MRRLLPVVLMGLLLLGTADLATGRPGSSAAPPAYAAGPANRLLAQASDGFNYGVLVADIGNAPRASEAGFGVMATTVSWSHTEPSRGQFPFEQTDQWGKTAPNDVTNVIAAAQGNGLRHAFRIIDPPAWAGSTPANVNPADLEDYAFHLVQYAHDGMAYLELFNEQNLAFEWGGPPDPAAYARLVAAVYRGAKRADPSVPVLSAGPSQRTGGRDGSMEDVDWLNGFLQAGGAASVDAVGVHAYLGSNDPSIGPDCVPLCFRQVEEFRAALDANNVGQPLYVTEFGTLEDTPTDLGQYNWMKLPSDVRADYLVRAVRLSADYPWLRGATVFNLDYAAAPWNNPNSDVAWFSLLNPDRSPRPAFTRIRQARATGELR